MAIFTGVDASKSGKAARQEVVEISLLLPTDRIEALIDLSKRSRESVGQILRRMIDDGLASEGAA